MKKTLLKTVRSGVFYLIVGIVIWTFFVYWFRANYYLRSPITVKIQSPIVRTTVSPLPKGKKVIPSKDIIVTTPTPQYTPTPTVVLQGRKIEGEASYYSWDGCMGCDENRIMANGEKLNDSAFTVALPPFLVNQNKLLNDMVKIENVNNGNTVIAKVTDTGGFYELTNGKRVADLSVATKEALGCSGLCQVVIYY